MLRRQERAGDLFVRVSLRLGVFALTVYFRRIVTGAPRARLRCSAALPALIAISSAAKQCADFIRRRFRVGGDHAFDSMHCCQDLDPIRVHKFIEKTAVDVGYEISEPIHTQHFTSQEII
jgi:hypothetical protein